MKDISDLPRDRTLDATLALLREGYDFIPNRAARLGHVFRTRLMLRNVICVHGPAGAQLLYGTPGLTRVGALPPNTLWLLQDKGSVQQLDGEAHRQRKAMFIRLLMDSSRTEELVNTFRETWLDTAARWERQDTIVLKDEADLVLARSAWRWCGLPPLEGEAGEELANELARMIDNAARVGPRNWFTIMRRGKLEDYLRELFRDLHEGRKKAPAGSPLEALATHRDAQGNLLPPDAATVELINILRPIVAIGRYITFAALTLHREPLWCELFTAGNESLIEDFAEELRRISPFFPMTGALTAEPVEWEGLSLPKGQWILFDIYGTLHDPEVFPEPGRFRPERMLSWKQQDFSFVPQGGGEVETTHRCPGEQITVEILKEAIALLCRHMSWTVPDQDLTVSRNRMPAQPASGLVLADVRRRARGDGTFGPAAGSASGHAASDTHARPQTQGD